MKGSWWMAATATLLAPAAMAANGERAQRSCDEAPAAGSDCNGESCCSRIAIPGGKFELLRDDGTTVTTTVAPYALDKYEATVGRFRRWIAAGEPLPAAGTVLWRGPKGKELRWKRGWRVQRGADLAGWKRYDTWTGGDDKRPKNNVSWFTALAFCAFDGGRLPTSAEWRFAAVGGEQNRRYPWGDDPPTADRALYDCLGDGNKSCSIADILPVGSRPLGVGRWGHMDLAGSMFEWTLEWSFAGDFPAASSRGGGFCYIGGVDRRAVTFLLPSAVRRDDPSEKSHMVGVRCAYDVAPEEP